MEKIPNSEKQARYRRKEQLKRKADNLIRKWQLEPWKHHSRTIQDAQYLVDKAIELPLNWTDEDYEIANIKLEHVSTELFWAVNQISNDIHESSNFSSKFKTSPDPQKLKADFEKSVEKTTALASHVISAIKLSECTEAEQAAALMEAMRFVGRTLAMNNREIPCSEATAMSLATIGPQYARPKWFSKKLAITISKQIDRDLSKEVGECLT